MNIRHASVTDIPSILQLIKEAVPLMIAAGNFQWDDTYPNAHVFERDIALKQLWVAEEDGCIAGVAAITTDQELEYAEVGWDITEQAIVTHRLAVSDKHKGKGIATTLLMKAEYEAYNRGIKTLRIDTNTSNVAPQRLFLKLGYQFSGEISLSFRPDQRFYCYEKRLDI